MNFGVKIAALLCAISLWLYVVAGKTYRIDAELPVHISHLSPLLAPATHIPKAIPVTLEGSGLDLARFHYQDSLAWIEIDLNHAALGKQIVSIDTRSFRCSLPTLQMLSAPGLPNLTIELDTRITRDIPVRLRRDIIPAPHYLMIGEPVLIPTTVQVSGARSVLTRVFEIATSPAPQQRVTSTDTLEVGLSMDGLPPQVTLSQKTVRIALQVQKRSTRTIRQVPIQFVGPYLRGQEMIQPEAIDLELTGGEAILDHLDPKEIRVFIEYSRFSVENTDSIVPTVVISQPIESWKSTPAVIHLIHMSPEAQP